MQQLSVTVRRGNAACVTGTMDDVDSTAAWPAFDVTSLAETWRRPNTWFRFWCFTDVNIVVLIWRSFNHFGRPFAKRFALCYQTVVCLSVCLSVCLYCPVCPVLSVCDVRALWPNGWTDQDETWHAGRTRPWALTTLCYIGTQLLFPHGVPAPHSSFSPLSVHTYCGQTVAHLSNCWAHVSFTARCTSVQSPVLL